MNLSLIKLKIKGKSLAEEARIIRKEERKLPGPDRAELRDHRVTTVRDAARATYLTIAYIRGKPYRSIEHKCHDESYRDTFIAARMYRMLRDYYDPQFKAENPRLWFYEQDANEESGKVDVRRTG